MIAKDPAIVVTVEVVIVETTMTLPYIPEINIRLIIAGIKLPSMELPKIPVFNV